MPSPLRNLAQLISNGVSGPSAAVSGDAGFGQEAGAESENLALKLSIIVSAVLMASVVARRVYRAARSYFGSHDPADHAPSPAPTPRADSSSVPEHRVVVGETIRQRTPSGEAARAAEEAALPAAAPSVAAAAPRAVSPQQPVAEVRVNIGDSSPERQDSPVSEASSSRASPSSSDRESSHGSWVNLTRAEAGSPSASSRSSSAWSEVEAARSTSPLLGASRSATPSR